jgi:glycosyltransferase involved in cell wall biosynthesis
MTGFRFAFDATVARTNRAGSGAYARRLLEGLRPMLGQRLVELDAPAARVVAGRKTVGDRMRTLATDLWWTQHAVDRAAAGARARLLHIPVGIGPVRGRLPLVLTVHDVAVLQFPERFPRWFRNYAAWAMPRSIRRADAIATVSESSRRDIVEWLRIPGDRIVVIPNAVEQRPPSDDHALAATRAKFSLPDRFVLTVGAIEPRKNLPRLLEAIASLASERGSRDVHLVHAGPPGWLADGVPEAVERLGLHDRVHFLGYVDATDLDDLYTLATVTAYPSLYEGYGLPILEAMARGSAVVTSNVSSMPEVAGGAALLVDPLRVDEIAAAIGRLWADETLQRELRARGRARASEFTIDRLARDTLALYERVAS